MNKCELKTLWLNRQKTYRLVIGLGSAVAIGLVGFGSSETAYAQATKKNRKKQSTVAQASSAEPKRQSNQLDMQKSSTALPQSQKIAPAPTRAVETVRPPRSGDFYDTGKSKEAEYEAILDREIAALYKLVQQNRRSPNRGELWLRLGERYVEKARLVDIRAQNEYDRKLKDFLAKKTSVKPRLEQARTREYNKKAVQLYEWFAKDFPKDPKIDQALFFLGYNHFELGNTSQGEAYYTDLVRRFPDSVFVTESHFALGEFYFENEKWQMALENYIKVVKAKNARLNTFALFKSSWCLFRLNRTNDALRALERVVRLSRADSSEEGGAGRRSVNKVRLASEALKDYVPFYAEVGDPKKAGGEFMRVSGDQKQAIQMLERLAYIYVDQGNKAGANYIFKQLIGLNPGGERAAEYQYQVVIAYATGDQKEFRKELEVWLESFGPQSYWARANAGNQQLTADVAKLQETTLRNFVLQQHQTAQNSRAPFSQKVASNAYSQYLRYFSDSPKIAEMQFFHAELLFDMQKYEEAARLYVWVAEKDPQGPYREKAIINALLALEKDLPDQAEIDKKRGKSLEKMPLDPKVERFEKAAIRFIQAFPKSEKTPDIQRRLGVLYYSYNHFEEAEAIFQQLMKNNPRSENAEIAGNLILDMYKLRNDMVGFAEKGAQFLANPVIASSKFGTKVRGMMETAVYLKAEKMADGGDSLKAAKEFEGFAGSYKQSNLASAARFKAAVAYEKGGDLTSAVRMHTAVLATPSNDPKIKAVKNDSRNSLARIYQQLGQLELAAKQYQAYAAANPKDQTAVNAFFNAGVLWDGLGETKEAMASYQAYFDQSKKPDRIEVLFSQAEMLRRNGQWAKAIAIYEKYLNSGPRSQANAVTSVYWIGKLSERKGQISNATRWYRRTIDLHGKSPKAARDQTVQYAAEARFFLAQETMGKLMAVRFTASDKQQAQAASDVKTLSQRYVNEMKEVIRYDYGPFIVAALASSGRMNDAIAKKFAEIPVPKGFNTEEAGKYKELIQQQVNGFRGEAQKSYKAAVDKAIELETFGEWTRIARAGLASFDQAAIQDGGELAGDARAMDWMGL